MALVSSGVQVSVIDESFYTPSEPGTTPLIFIATTENKSNPGGTGIAPGTLAANAEKVYLVSSQRELSETFGDARFYTDLNNNPIHGGEQNEYGLQAAYSFLGVSNRAYVVRANIDLSSLDASAEETAGKPTNGAYWFDTNDTNYGIFEWNAAPASTTNGQSFSNKLPLVITDTTKVVDFTGEDYTPKGSVGAVGEYAIVAVTNINKLWYKAASGTWHEVGSTGWVGSIPAVVGTATANVVDLEDFTINGNTVTVSGTVVADFVTQLNALTDIAAELVNSRLVISVTGAPGADLVITGDTALLDAIGIPAATYTLPRLTIAPHTQVPQYKTGGISVSPSGSIWLKTTSPNLGANWNVKVYNSATDAWTAIPATIHATNHAALFALDQTGGGTNVSEGALYIQSNTSEAATPLGSFKIFRKNSSGPVSIVSAKVNAQLTASTYTFEIRESVVGQAALSGVTSVSFTALGEPTDADVLANEINSAGLTYVTAGVDSQNRVVISHSTGGEIRITDTAAGLAKIFTVFDNTNSASTLNFYSDPIAANAYIVSHWKGLNYTASVGEPTTTPADGALWYSSIIDEVDMMYHNGTTWVGYADVNAFPDANTSGPLVSASAPLLQSDNSALEEGDLWISTADIENFPIIYRRTAAGAWDLIDSTDQTSENGILFADARYNTAGKNSNVAGDISEMMSSNYLDPDAPDPALYPQGMLLWNLRRSGFNVKRFERDYIDVNDLNTRFQAAGVDESMAAYAADRWVTESSNNADGSGSFGRNAQRKVIVQKLQSVVNSSEDARDDESRIFNLIATPGYPELIGEMINLNFDRGLTSFVIGDSPLRLKPTTTELNNWATNVNLAVEDNDRGLVSRDEYMGVYYPGGFTSDNSGNNIVVPASHMVLRTFALNDQVAYPWFAPAGTRRGGVSNATAAGYISSEGEFVSIALNEGQRDTLQLNNVNPITFLNGAGLVIFGQKTRARNASSLDRVNVARLVIYLRSQLKQVAKPYIYEPNDKLTRDELKQQVESLMVELVSLRALYDFLVVCDESNNTPARIDRGELYVDIAIEPVKAVEFIYIPLRLKNTGEISGL
jgi:hypothetical protein